MESWADTSTGCPTLNRADRATAAKFEGQTGHGIAAGIGSGGGCSASSGVTNTHPLQAAAIFLGLYVATGIVAAVGAYFTHNPYRGRYAAAAREYRKASERASASIHQFGLARAAYQRQQAEIRRLEDRLAKLEAILSSTPAAS